MGPNQDIDLTSPDENKDSLRPNQSTELLLANQVTDFASANQKEKSPTTDQGLVIENEFPSFNSDFGSPAPEFSFPNEIIDFSTPRHSLQHGSQLAKEKGV